MESAPKDVLNLIFSFLDTIKDSLTILLVCKWWNKIINNDSRWKSLGLKFWDTTISEAGIDLSFIQSESAKRWLW
jgi:hypothetical protein